MCQRCSLKQMTETPHPVREFSSQKEGLCGKTWQNEEHRVPVQDSMTPGLAAEAMVDTRLNCLLSQDL